MNKTILYTLLVLIFVSGAQAADFSVWAEDTQVDEFTITANLFSNETLDKFEYAIDSEWTTACEDCDNFVLETLVDSGDHVLELRGTLDYENEEASYDFTIEAIALEIIRPEENEDDEDVTLEFSTFRVTDIDYILDGESYDACTNCTHFEEDVELETGSHYLQVFAHSGDFFEYSELNFEIDGDELNLQILSPTEDEDDEDVLLEFRTNLDEGEHTLEVRAETDDEVDTESIDFEVIGGELNLRIVSPDEEEEDGDVLLRFRTNVESDITYVLDDEDFDACEDCTVFSRWVTLDEGEHTLEVRAEIDDESDTESLDFEVLEESDEDDEDENDEHRDFAEGFNKLPQMFASGELTDEELADILSENRVPPGVINRLIKTGELDEESLNAILKHQFNPPGILKKVFGWFGWRTGSYSDRIHERYNLSEENEQEIVKRSDLQKDKMNKVKTSLQNKVEQRAKNKFGGRTFEAAVELPPGQAKKAGTTNVESGTGSKTSPGQAKKIGYSNTESGTESKTPPGQAKKMGTTNSGSKTSPGQAKKSGKGNSGWKKS